MVSSVALLLVTGLHGQTSAISALRRAEAMHESLQRRPVSQRPRAEYLRVAAMMTAVWSRDDSSNTGQQAEYEAGSVYVALAVDQHNSSAWQSAVDCFSTLIRKRPYSSYRRNAEWALAQIELNHLGQSSEAKRWLKDFTKLYPADPRAEIAHQQMRGERVSNVPVLGQRTSGPAPLPLAASAARDDAPRISRRRPADETRHSATRGNLEAPRAERAPVPPQNTNNVFRGPRAAGNRSSAAATNGSGQQVRSGRTAIARRETSAREIHAHESTPAALPLGRLHEVIFGRVGDASAHGLNQILGLRAVSEANETTVVVDLTHPVHVTHAALPGTHRYYFDLHDSEMGSLVTSSGIQKVSIHDGRVLEIHIGQNRQGVIRLVIDVASGQVSADDGSILTGPPRFEVRITAGHGESQPHSPSTPAAPPPGLSLARSSTPPPHATGEEHTARITRDQAETLSARKPAAATGVARAHRPAMAPAPPPLHESTPPRPETTTTETQVRTATAPVPASAPPLHADATPTASHHSTSATSAAPAPPGSLYTASGDPPTSTGSRSLTRVLGLKIHKIVLDAGHGGHDTGTIGPDDLYEKDVVLDVTRRLGRLLQDRLGMDVIYTRKTDVFIPLQERTAIANRANADLFLSIHANSSDDHSVRGIETYYLDFTQNPRALAVAARENATGELSTHSLQTLIQRIALNDKQQESREFAGDLLTNLVSATRVEDRGVKSAPFVVLIGARMPSVLAEISFLSDATDARLLRNGAYRERIAEALYNGVKRYLESLNGVQAVAAGEPGRAASPHLRTVSERTH